MPCVVKANPDTLFISSRGQLVDAQDAEYFQVNQKGKQKKYAVSQYWMDGVLKFEAQTNNHENWGLDGVCIYYWHTGKKKKEGSFKDGRKKGLWKYYDSLGRLERESIFAGGSLNDTERLYNPEKGILSKKLVYKYGNFVSEKSIDENGKEYETPKGDSIIFPILKYRNGISGFLNDNLHVSFEDFENEIDGVVYVRNIIDSTGKLVDYEIIRSLSITSDREVMRLFAIMPDWEPALKDGRPIEFKGVLPLTFKLGYSGRR